MESVSDHCLNVFLAGTGKTHDETVRPAKGAAYFY